MVVLLQIEVPDELAHALEIFSSSLGLSIDEIFVEALSAYMEEMEDNGTGEYDYYDQDIPQAS